MELDPFLLPRVLLLVRHSLLVGLQLVFAPFEQQIDSQQGVQRVFLLLFFLDLVLFLVCHLSGIYRQLARGRLIALCREIPALVSSPGTLLQIVQQFRGQCLLVYCIERGSTATSVLHAFSLFSLSLEAIVL